MSQVLVRAARACVVQAMLAVAVACPALVWAEALPQVEATLVAFNSDEGLARLARSTARQDFAALANQFEAQSNIAFCGPTTAAIVLNALYAGSPELPRDRSRLRAGDFQYLATVIDLSVPRFTQDNVITLGRKTRAQVLGEAITVDGQQVRDPGYQLRQLDELLRAHGALTTLVIVDDKKPEQDVRHDLIENLQQAGNYVVINYKRSAAGQPGGAHISPLGSYDAQTDSFLVMDVNPSSAGWVWMPAGHLIKGMRTFDTVENRGYILVSRPPPGK
jgi:hypothetical protein